MFVRETGPELKEISGGVLSLVTMISGFCTGTTTTVSRVFWGAGVLSVIRACVMVIAAMSLSGADAGDDAGGDEEAVAGAVTGSAAFPVLLVWLWSVLATISTGPDLSFRSALVEATTCLGASSAGLAPFLSAVLLCGSPDGLSDFD